MFVLLTGIFFPATPTPFSVIADFALLFVFVKLTLSFIKGLSSGA